MASKENQRALNNLVYFADPFDQDEFNRVERWKNTLQKAIDDLELYKRALDKACMSKTPDWEKLKECLLNNAHFVGAFALEDEEGNEINIRSYAIEHDYKFINRLKTLEKALDKACELLEGYEAISNGELIEWQEEDDKELQYPYPTREMWKNSLLKESEKENGR